MAFWPSFSQVGKAISQWEVYGMSKLVPWQHVV